MQNRFNTKAVKPSSVVYRTSRREFKGKLCVSGVYQFHYDPLQSPLVRNLSVYDRMMLWRASSCYYMIRTSCLKTFNEDFTFRGVDCAQWLQGAVSRCRCVFIEVASESVVLSVFFFNRLLVRWSRGFNL